jgi:hypothetical protein
MIQKQVVFILLFYFLSNDFCYAQEWKNLSTYKKEAGFSVLEEGNWLRKDRKRNTAVWKSANIFNLLNEQASSKYTNIHQIRDFYIWFDEVRKEQNHEVNWVGIAAIAAGNLAKLDNSFVKIFVTNDKEIQTFAEQGSRKVFDFAIPELKKIYFLEQLLTGEEARNWDYKYGRIEQCDILSGIYNKLSDKAIKKLQKMAEGKGIYSLVIPKELKFKGDLKNCEARYNYSINTLLEYYKNQ